VAESCEHCNEFLGSVKGRQFFDQLSGCKLLNEYSPPHSERSRTIIFLALKKNERLKANENKAELLENI
jgi:phage FluMu protein Com